MVCNWGSHGWGPATRMVNALVPRVYDPHAALAPSISPVLKPGVNRPQKAEPLKMGIKRDDSLKRKALFLKLVGKHVSPPLETRAGPPAQAARSGDVLGVLSAPEPMEEAE